MKEISIGLLGLGTIGAGLYRLIEQNGRLIEAKAGINVRLRRAVDVDSSLQAKLGIPDEAFSTDAADVVDNPDIDLVVELIGGTGVARDLVLRALEGGKHVVTANKALLAEHGGEIFRLAADRSLHVGFEGSVGGGIPIIKTIREALVGNEIEKVVGILNGTTNFILTKMTREGIDFASALRAAQENGFAEADPTLDVSGGDTQHKIVLLASFAFNTLLDMSGVYVEGIEHIEERDMEYASELGFVLKLLALADKNGEDVLVRVHPTLVPSDNPLAAISWEDNAVMVYSDFLGKSMYYGKGAGAKPTASAVVADIVDIAKDLCKREESSARTFPFFRDLHQLPFEKSRSRFYFRFLVLDRPGILSKIAGILGRNGISIASVIQKETEEEHEQVPLVMMTHQALEADVRTALKEIDTLDEVRGSSILIRVVDID